MLQQVRVASHRAPPGQTAPGSPRLAPQAALDGLSPPRRSPQRRRGAFTGVTWLGLAALTGIVAYAIGTGGGADVRTGRPLRETVDSLAVALGLAITQVEIKGHSFTTDSAINEALDLPSGSSMLSFDGAAARRRIEQLPWIDTATVTRVLPDRIQVAVTEREAFARWQSPDGTYLIDRTGRVLSPLHTGGASHLPLVAGEGAGKAAATILSIVASHPAIATRVELFERVDGRRWTLHLDGNLAIHLPAEGEALALDRVTAAGVAQGLSAMSATEVDVRVPSGMIVSRGAAQGSAPGALPRSDTRPPAGRPTRETDSAQRG